MVCFGRTSPPFDAITFRRSLWAQLAASASTSIVVGARRPLFYQPNILSVAKPSAASFYPAEDNAILMRFRPLPTVSASLTTFGSSEGCSTVHSQNDAITAARSTESFEANNPASMMGIRAAAALRRLISGVGGGICFDRPKF